MRNRLVAAASLSALFLLSLACQKAQPPVAYVKYNSEADVPRISIQDAKAAIDDGSAVMVDSRPPEAFKIERVQGALNIPLGPDAESKFSTLPQGKKIIVYCSWPNEHTSASLAFQMNQKNIAGTYALLGGNIAWKAAGYPMDKPANP